MNMPPEWQLAMRILALAIPTILLLASLARPGRAPLLLAQRVTGLTFGLSAVVAIGTWLPGLPSSLTLGVQLGSLTSVMLVLVSGLGFAIQRFSRSYLAGDPGESRYVRWMLATLAAVTALVLANNLLVIALAWTATSLSLHQLLTFYDRPAALVAAHKKFLASRVADACLLVAIVLVHMEVGSLNLEAIHSWVGAQTTVPVTVSIAGMLFAVAACVKCAQLPLHGWLTQVMEAPTPVSALLHAGIVNIGGFLMIRLAPLMAQTPGAQMFLVVVGGTSAVLAALIMTTRVSIKVALAWSTCAQMGFMLVQCGLGAWHLALLHLVAHSCYKAHAFLSSGSTVDAWRVRSLSPRLAPTPLGRTAALAAASLAVVFAAMVALRVVPGLQLPWSMPLVVLGLLVGLALVPMLQRGLETRSLGVVTVQAGLWIALYFGWHVFATSLLEVPAFTAPTAAWLLVGAGVLILFAVQSVLAAAPHGRLARQLHPVLFAGCYLDERFTRLTFRLWPTRIRAVDPTSPVPVAQTKEA